MQKPSPLLHSKSQIARVLTESWVSDTLYCVACSSPKLSATPANTPTIDFFCPSCKAIYQLKSKSKPFGKRLLGASYSATIAAFQKGETPHLLLLQYSQNWTVVSLVLIPSFSISASAIEKRPPLGSNARRAGWIGCNISLDQIPRTAKIDLVISGKVSLSEDTRAAFKKIQPLGELAVKPRGWTLDVLRIVQNLSSEFFSLTDVYAYEAELTLKHPDNNNIRAKIRQQLQVLRDLGLISFLKRGTYKIVNVSN